MTDPLYDDEVQLPGGPRLALRRADGDGRPFLLVHGLSSNARLWDGTARAAGRGRAPGRGRRPARARPVRAGGRRLHHRAVRRRPRRAVRPARADRRARAGGRRPVLGRQRRADAGRRARRGRRRRAGRRRLDLARPALPDVRAVLGRARAAGAARAVPGRARRPVPRVVRRLPAGGHRRRSSPTSPRTPTGTRVARLTREHHRRSCARCGRSTRARCSRRSRAGPARGRRRRREDADRRAAPTLAASLLPDVDRVAATSAPTTTCTPSSPTGWPPTCSPSPRGPRRWSREPPGRDGLGRDRRRPWCGSTARCSPACPPARPSCSTPRSRSR